MAFIFVALSLLVFLRTGDTSSGHKSQLPNGRGPIERQVVVLTSTDAQRVAFAPNLLASIEKTGARPNVTIFAEDEASYKALSGQNLGLRVLKLGAGTMPGSILQYLKQGLEVFLVRCDAYWFQDPFPYFDGDFDFALTKDRPRIFNLGLAYFKPTNRTLAFVTEWVGRLTQEKKPAQDVMNRLLTKRFIQDLKFKLLNSENFPNGGYFFPFYPNLSKCRNDTSTTVVFFAAYIDLDKSKEAFRRCNMWLGM